MRHTLARVNQWLDDTDEKLVVATTAGFLAAFLAALAWGSALVVDVLLAAAFVWAVWRLGGLDGRVDRAWDDADLAVGKAEAIEAHLAGLEPPGTGRHGHRG